MKTKIVRELSFVLLHITPFIYLWIIYSSLPEIVPTHFNAAGVADGFSDRSTLIWILLGLNGIGYFLFLLIPLIDPKKFATNFEKIYLKIRIGISLLLVSLSILLLYLTTGDPLKGIMALAIVFAVLCIFLGNYLQAVRSNYFIGIRTPWTLSSEQVWRKTHLITGRVLFYGGMVSVITLFFIPANLAPVGPVAVLVGGSIFGLIYSYVLYKNEKKEIV